MYNDTLEASITLKEMVINMHMIARPAVFPERKIPSLRMYASEKLIPSLEK